MVHNRLATGISAAALLALSMVRPGDAAAVLSPGINARTMTFNGDMREYDVYVPASYDGSSAVPLVVDLHGAGSTKVQQRGISGMRQRADGTGFLVAYPQGLFNTWNAGVCCGQAQSMNIDDVGFLRAVVDAVAAEANIDGRRVYATGLSNGGAMTHRLACEAADVFAAFAPMASPRALFPCLPSRPLALLQFMGLNDQIVPYTLGPPSFEFWRTTNGCVGASPDQTVVTGDSFCESYLDCDAGVETGMCSITSTSPPPLEGHILYLNDDLVLADVAWDFLSRFTLPVSLDHFKCYKAKDLKQPKFVSTVASLSDQFGVNDGDFEIKKPFLLCNPASKNGEESNNVVDHLTCYKIKGPKLDRADRPEVVVHNQLGTLDLQVKKPFLLCVPSLKTVLP